jgi:hypothetical protein
MSRGCLQPEQAPDLAPRRHRKHDAGCDEQEQHEPEAGACTAAPSHMLDTRAPPGAVLLVRPSNCVGVQRRSVVALQRTRDPLARRLPPLVGHGESIRGPRAPAASEIGSRLMLRERRFDTGLFGLGDGLALVAGVVLAVSSFTGWYSGEGEGVTISALGWNTGVLGKLVLFVGLAVVLVVVLREVGVETPSAVPQSLLTVALGALGTVFVLIRVISVPDDFFWANRGVGLWISLAAAIGVIVAGLFQASEEL